MKLFTGTFSHWWAALAAVPGSRTELDWWAKPDGRASRYERLKRVWFDTTRNNWFYGMDQEDHLTATLWENFAIFDPRSLVPALVAAAGLPPVRDVSDACWSYEYEERVDGRLKQIDVTLHYRDADGDGLLVVETKRPGGSLKPSDRDPSYYLDPPSFGFASCRRTIYLVDERDLASVRSVVKQTDPKPGFLTWQRLGLLQVALAEQLPLIPPLIWLVGHLIQGQFERHGFHRVRRWPSRSPPTGPWSARMVR
jgi:hypothetical protein